MKTKTLSDSGKKTFAIIFDAGEDPVKGLTDFALDHRIRAASLSAIGGFRKVVLGYFDFDKKDYLRNPFDEQLEVVSLLGNIALFENRPKLHAHVVVGRRDGAALGGHLLEASVNPTLEVMLEESPGWLQRWTDRRTGLALIGEDRG